MTRRLPALAACCIALVLAAVSSFALAAPPAHDTLRIGSKRFTESYILAQVLAQTAAPHTPTPPSVLQGLGNTAIVYEALRSGSIDLYPEYVGTISQEILKGDAAMTTQAMNAALAPLGLGVAVPLGFNDGYALAMREDTAQRLGISSLSDLAKHPELKLGLSNEFIGRADGWRGLAQRYGAPQVPVALDHGLAYDAIAQKQVDVIDIYTTDAKIGHLGLRVLKDDQAHFPRYDAVLLYRLDVPTRFPQAWAALQKLSGSIDENAMIAMNARAELQGVAFDVIARDHLAAKAGGVSIAAAGTGADPSQRGFWAKLFGPDLARLTRQHLALTLISVGLAALIGIPLAVWVFPHPRLRALVLGATGLMQTVPSLALLAMLISLMGVIGTMPALIALMLYALLPIMRNTVAGLNEVSPGLRLAGQALGMTSGQRLRHIELPLALPTIVAGVRTAIAIAIGTATIAAFIGAGGYGERIVTGLALNDGQLLLAGALPATLLALLSEALFEGVERLMRRRRAG
ncbi:MAG: glycine betaine ABC transporter substrate-binding protein [Polaromonas sp.]|uniref:glycine betaine ABC transporter substrate-binding protein n=1 Tax=Polaromonas sp. TaxID=1869339 RepID=UPI002731E3F8|nr:glycine betaine ABC transporter substrate-binding protein [Polaromonas sp.]MDP2451440.1 glycine betaine ABC transporter substrate-binding protein [Polaromonas sp.]MDP3246148.1 glycine betaine ABC transporter substrate-binding protein [Polaromonas sp.]MDP3755443.1 glycine betaine ABC transporter substrate-binding protein [Polaromonas sp.]